MNPIETLWKEARELSFGTEIDTIESPPTPLEFLRDYVSQNKPCLISNATLHWRALSLWPDHSYLCKTLAEEDVSVHLTPNGRADALASIPHAGEDLCFATSHVDRLPFPEALKAVLSSEKGKKVAYLQQQNDCFRTEYSALAADCDEHIAWASHAMGRTPEAVNLWIGNHLSETSFHKDHYENLYAVVTGQKHFLLLPPTEAHRLYIRDYPSARYFYSHGTGMFVLEMEEPETYVPWCSVDPYPSSPKDEDRQRSKFPLYFNGPRPFRCTVKAGEILFLPSMWFHHVRQSPDERGCTIAVNYWYDMQFDIKYAYFNFLRVLPYRPSNENEDSGPEASGCCHRDEPKIRDSE